MFMSERACNFHKFFMLYKFVFLNFYDQHRILKENDECIHFIFILFQICLSRHLHCRNDNQTHRPRVLHILIYISKRCLELAGFYSHFICVSILLKTVKEMLGSLSHFNHE